MSEIQTVSPSEITNSVEPAQLYEAFNEFEPYALGVAGIGKKGVSEIVVPGPENIRQAREDAYFQDINTFTGEGILGVFDGMGGHEGSAQIASSAASEVAARYFNTKFGEAPTSQQEAIAEMRGAFASLAELDVSLDTTALLARTWRNKEGEMQVSVASVGDSMAYMLDGSTGEIVALNKPHDIFEVAQSLVFAQLQKEGATPYTAEAAATWNADLMADANSVEDYLEKAEELVRAYPEVRPHVSEQKFTKYFKQRNQITSYLEHIKSSDDAVRITHYAMEPGQRLIVMSDGVSDPLTSVEIGQTVIESDSTRDAAVALVGRASQKQGMRRKDDDKSVIVYELDADEEPEVRQLMAAVHRNIDDPAARMAAHLDAQPRYSPMPPSRTLSGESWQPPKYQTFAEKRKAGEVLEPRFVEDCQSIYELAGFMYLHQDVASQEKIEALGGIKDFVKNITEVIKKPEDAMYVTSHNGIRRRLLELRGADSFDEIAFASESDSLSEQIGFYIANPNALQGKDLDKVLSAVDLALSTGKATNFVTRQDGLRDKAIAYIASQK